MEHVEPTTNQAIPEKKTPRYIREDLNHKIQVYRLQYPGTIKSVKQFVNDAVEAGIKAYEKRMADNEQMQQ